MSKRFQFSKFDSKQTDEDLNCPWGVMGQHHTQDNSPRMSLQGACGLLDSSSSDRLVRKNRSLSSEQSLVSHGPTGYRQRFDAATQKPEYKTPDM